MKFFANAFVLVICVVLGSGCATKALWEEGQFARFHEPASPPNVELFQKGERLLVVYDEETEDGERRKRRAFWADLDSEPPEQPFRPRFVRVNRVERLEGLRLVSIGGAPAVTDFSAVTNYVQGFTLFKDGKEVWVYRLPVYEDNTGRMKQIALTPLTVVADLTIFGGVLVFYWIGNGGLSGTTVEFP
jgi:hypothetical protein